MEEVFHVGNARKEHLILRVRAGIRAVLRVFLRDDIDQENPRLLVRRERLIQEIAVQPSAKRGFFPRDALELIVKRPIFQHVPADQKRRAAVVFQHEPLKGRFLTVGVLGVAAEGNEAAHLPALFRGRFGGAQAEGKQQREEQREGFFHGFPLLCLMNVFFIIRFRAAG